MSTPQPVTGAPTPTLPRRRFIEGAAGTRAEAFGPAEWGLVAGIALIWGSSFLFIDIALEGLAPGAIALFRVFLGALTLALVPRARRPVAREDLGRVAFLGATWMAIPLILFPVAQQWIDSAVAGMINGAVPLTAAAWSVLLLRRLPGRVQRAGLLVGFLGVLAISWPEAQDSSATALGAALIVAAVILYGLSVNVAVPLQQRYGSLPVLLRAQLAALIMLLPFGLWSLGSSTWVWGPLLAMIPLGVLGTGLAFVLMTTLVGRAGASRGSVALYFVPIFAILLGVVVRDESVSLIALAGTALVLAGAFLTSRREGPAPSVAVPDPSTPNQALPARGEA